MQFSSNQISNIYSLIFQKNQINTTHRMLTVNQPAKRISIPCYQWYESTEQTKP